MKANLKQNVLSAAISFACMTLAAAPAYASDTEVYVQSIPADPNNSPTLMMVLDTSGSMDYCMTSDRDCSVGSRRIDVMASAMRKILFGDLATEVKPAPGYIRMGFARFIPEANKGGWVRYPARPLDAFVEINPNGDVTSVVGAGTQDAVQSLSLLSNATGNSLEIGGSLNQAAGLHFSNIMVPKGATITSAYIELTARSSNSGLSTWEIGVEDTATASDFSGLGVNTRTYGSVTTHQPSEWVANTAYQIPISSLVQSISDRSDWCGGNSMAFRIRDIGATPTSRSAYSFEGAGATEGYKPRLVINFSIDPKKTDSCIKMTRTGRSYPVKTTLDDAQWVASPTAPIYNNNYLTPNTVNASNVRTKVDVRLQGVNIPKGANITRAELVATVRRTVNVKPTAVAAYNTDNMPAFCTGTRTVTCAIPTTAVTSAVVTPATATSYSAGSLLRFDVRAPLTSIISRAGWVSGNAVGFRVMNNLAASADSGTLEVYDASGDLARAMTLSVDWTETVYDLSKLRTVRDDLADELTPDRLAVDGGTPLGSAYGEASLYMHGMHTSHDTTGETAYIDPRTVDENLDYISPMTSSSKCGANYIFMMTDGDPNDLANVQPISKSILGRTCSNEAAASGNGKALNWYCMFDLAQYNALPTNRSGIRLRTNTVLFGPLATDAAANLKKMADLGQGNYYKAGDEAALVNALTETLNALISSGASVAAPGVAVNQLNRLSHLDQLYYAVFDPEPQKTRWEGNLKRYRLDLANEQIKDADNENAVDPSTGFFRDGTRSFWSVVEDGAKAVEGGAAAKQVPANRTQYTYMGSLSSKNQALTKMDLTSSSFNTAAKALTGVSTDDEYFNLMNWYKGYVIPSLTDGRVAVDSASITRNRLGAGLHSKPVLVTYGYTSGTDSTNPDNQQNYVFFSTMEGTLHAIEAKTGLEKFSFMPGEKLSVLRTLFENGNATLPEFGMDLSWTVYRKDANFDNQIGTGDKIHIYGGMRMGGDNYYALDVSNINSPKLLFAIDGGSTANGGKYSRMGQTWSQPVLGNMKIGGSTKTVIVFGGGYDPRHETAGRIFTGNDLGNGLYIVDAFDGTLYWSATGNTGDNPTKYVSAMKYSVPTAPKLVDVNGDGLVDAIYFGDLGGQMFRVDINNGASSEANLAKRVKLIASLGQTVTADVLNQRRFYEPATVALFEDKDEINDGRLFAAVSFGSGYRSHPLNEATQERFYTLLDFDVTREDLLSLDENSSSLRAAVTPSDLDELDVSSDEGADKSKQGWYVNLPDGGEKSMASGLIFNNELIFTTYVPTMVGGNECSPVIGRTKLYRQCMPYGGVGDTCSWEGDRVQDNVMMGIGGEPQYIFQGKDPAAEGEDTLTGGVLVGSTVISDGDYKPRLKRLHRFREKRN